MASATALAPLPPVDAYHDALNQHLATRSYMVGYRVSAGDFTLWRVLPKSIDRGQWPHLARWADHIAALAATSRDQALQAERPGEQQIKSLLHEIMPERFPSSSVHRADRVDRVVSADVYEHLSLDEIRKRFPHWVDAAKEKGIPFEQWISDRIREHDDEDDSDDSDDGDENDEADNEIIATASRAAVQVPSQLDGMEVKVDPVDPVDPVVPVEPAALVEEEDPMAFLGDDEDDEETKTMMKQKADKIKQIQQRQAADKGKAKSNIVLDIKPLDDETDMKKLKQDVEALRMDGLVKWFGGAFIDVAFGIQKLRITAQVLDDVLRDGPVDSVQTLIAESLPDQVQSTDLVAFQMA